MECDTCVVEGTEWEAGRILKTFSCRGKSHSFSLPRITIASFHPSHSHIIARWGTTWALRHKEGLEWTRCSLEIPRQEKGNFEKYQKILRYSPFPLLPSFWNEAFWVCLSFSEHVNSQPVVTLLHTGIMLRRLSVTSFVAGSLPWTKTITLRANSACMMSSSSNPYGFRWHRSMLRCKVCFLSFYSEHSYEPSMPKEEQNEQ